MARGPAARAGIRPLRPSGVGWALPSEGLPQAAQLRQRATQALLATVDVLVLFALPMNLMAAFHVLSDLTLKAAYTAAALAALAAGDEGAVRLSGGRPLTGRAARRTLTGMAAVLLAGAAAQAWANPLMNATTALVSVLWAAAVGFWGGWVRPIPRQSFPFATRLGLACSPHGADTAAFSALLGSVVLAWLGPLAGMAVAALLLILVAVWGDDAAFAPPARAVQASPLAPVTRPLPAPWRAVADRLHRWVGDQGLVRSFLVAEGVAVAYQALWALALYKMLVHMEFSILAVGLLAACGALGEWLALRALEYVSDRRLAALGLYAGGLTAVGMFAGIAGSAFPPLEFTFWGGAVAAAAFVDGCRHRLWLGPPGPPGQSPWPSTPLARALGPLRLWVMLLAGYLVWWVSTWLVKPHSINLVLTVAGCLVALTMVWGVLPAAVGQGKLPENRPLWEEREPFQKT
jgi:hypothetical protein